MSAPQALPVTKFRLLKMIGGISLPSLVRMGLFGLSYQERGKYRHTAADELAYPSQAILARILVEYPRLALPVAFPSPLQFRDAMLTVEPQMRRLSLRLGKESSFLSRAIRSGDSPGAAAWALMALVCTQGDGLIATTWSLVERAALIEATARGIHDLDAAGRWPHEARIGP